MDRDWAERLRRSDVSALEEVMDAYSAYAAKIIAACLGPALPKEDMEEALAMTKRFEMDRYDVLEALTNNSRSLH